MLIDVMFLLQCTFPIMVLCMQPVAAATAEAASE